MVTAQLDDCTFELESEFVVDIDDLRVFTYSDLCRCSKDAFRRCLALWGLDGIEKILLMGLVRFLGTLTDEMEMGGPWIGVINVY